MVGHRSAHSGLVLHDRRVECTALDRLLEAARAGRSGVLLVRGEPGIGKTALLDYLMRSGSDLRVVRVTGVASEKELAFAALHQLFASMLDRLERIPGPQRAALATAFGLQDGPVPDRFLVGLAALGLLSEVAEQRPLVCVVDDAQWLDKASAQTLAFVARRLLAESVVMVFAARELTDELRGLPELVVEGLTESDASELLASVIRWPLDEGVRAQILAETRGNPLALIELPRGLSPAQLAGGFGLAGALSLAGRIEERFLRRIEALPEDSALLLLLAAAEPIGDPALLRRAATLLGIEGSAFGPAEATGLIEIGQRVRFRHPLVRSGIYRAASSEERRQVHQSLAQSTDVVVDPDRRAWHLAEAAVGPDEDVAAELERSAERAQARGGFAAAAAFLERATAFTVEPLRRTERAISAAQAKVLAGALDVVPSLLATAEASPLTELQLARIKLVRAQLAYVTSRGNDAAPLLLSAAELLEPIAPELAGATYLDALSAAIFAGRFAANGGSIADVMEAAGAARRDAPSAPDRFLDGLATAFSHGYIAGLPILREALVTIESEPTHPEQHAGSVHNAQEGYAFLAAIHTWDDDATWVVAHRWAKICREAGAVTELPLALTSQALALLLSGDIAGAALLTEELGAAAEAIGIGFGPYAAMGVAAYRGDESAALALIEAGISEASLRGEGNCLSAGEWAKAVLKNGLGRYAQGLAAAQRASEGQWEFVFSNWALAELVEAGVRSGMTEAAAEAHGRLAEMAVASGTDWALGIEARCRGLLSEKDAAAEGLYREAIERLGRTRIRTELARAHLLYGEWLRRERRRSDAREELRAAHGMFSMMSLQAFAGRAENAPANVVSLRDNKLPLRSSRLPDWLAKGSPIPTSAPAST